MANRKQRRQTAKARARDIEIHLNAARACLETGDLVSAVRSCQGALTVDPRAAGPHHLLAHVAYAQGRLMDAGKHIVEAAKRDEENVDIHADCGAIMNMLGRPAEAEAACRHVLDLHGNHIGAWNNLAVALDVQGRLREALAACDEVLARDRDFVDALINKGSVLVKMDEPVIATEVLTRAVELVPDNPLARVNLATSLRSVGERDGAEAQCRAALELRPDYPEAHGALGDIFAATREFEKAIDAYDQALECRPGFIAVRLNRAAALLKLGKLEAAAEGYRSVLKDFDDSADAHAGLGVVQLATGDLAAAANSFRKAVELDPRQAVAWAALASSPDAILSDDDLRRLNEMCASEAAPLESRIAAHFSLGEVFDRRQNYVSAFEHFHAGNEARKTRMAASDHIFESEHLAADVSAIIDAYRAEPFDSIVESDDERPVFIVGMPRSGTTLVEQILASHPDVMGAGEAMSVAALPPDMSDDEMVQSVLEKLTQHGTGSKRIVDKTPFHFRNLGLIRRLFPKARIVHCLRDPMDTGLSCYMQNFVEDYPWSCDLAHIGCFINAYRQLMDHWRTVISNGFMEVSYEDLVDDPEPHIRNLIQFLGLDWDEACMAHHQSRRTVLSASSWQVRQPIYTSSKGRAVHYANELVALRKVLDAGA
jgi:tetratricopeptide (TPR) repeat protein